MKEDPNDIVREDFGEIIDSVKAEEVAADWEDGPWKSSKPFKGVTNPTGAIIVRRQLCHKSAWPRPWTW